MVFGDVDALGDRVPATLGEAFRALEEDGSVADRLATAQMCHDTPSLRARHLEKHLQWQALFAPDIGIRLGLSPEESRTDPRPRALVAAALACRDVAVEVWRASGGVADLETVFLDCAAAIRS